MFELFVKASAEVSNGFKLLYKHARQRPPCLKLPRRLRLGAGCSERIPSIQLSSPLTQGSMIALQWLPSSPSTLVARRKPSEQHIV